MARSWLNLLAALVARVAAFRHSDGQSENLSSNRSALRFSIINNSSLPLNLLALPKLARVYAHTQNNVQPGERFSFFAALGAYDLHATIQDDHNDWYQVNEMSWGVTKDGVALTLGLAAGAGVTGTLALTASAAVTATLATAAAPLVVTLAATATFWGVAVFSSMACSFLSEISMDFLREQMEEVEDRNGMQQLRQELNAQKVPLVDLTHKFGSKDTARFESGDYLCCCTKPTASSIVCELVPSSTSWYRFGSGCSAAGDGYYSWQDTKESDKRCVVPKSPLQQLTTGPERLVAFSKVVKEEAVLRSFRASFPETDVNRTVMTFATAEKYFIAMQSKFSEWKLVKGKERTFVIVGGFMNARRLPLLSEESWTVIDFVPLQMGEMNPTHGCKAKDLDFWGSQEKACEIQCGGASDCVSACVEPFRPAVDQAVELQSLMMSIEALPGRRVQVLGKDAILASAAAAMIPDAQSLELFAGQAGKIVGVDLHFLTAELDFGNSTRKFPLEALAESGIPLLTNAGRRGMSGPRYGQCWSDCSNGFWRSTYSGLKTAATLGAAGAWCYTSPDAKKPVLEHGSLCVEDDECQTLDPDAAEPWVCVDTCN
ncbi:unnamed protein product [Effrenium voratum]|nr:unnamed protein product [Effrenium voratum]